MKLYYSKGACSLAVRILLNELKIESDFEAVNLATKQTESGKDFLQINPKGAVPTLELDDGQILTENAIIHQYLAEKRQGEELLPSKDFNRYRVLEWLNFITTELHKGFGPLFNPSIPQNVKDEIFKPLLVKKFEYVNKQLGQNKYLLGNSYSLPDGYLFVMLLWAHKLKVDISNQTNLLRYFNELKDRASVKQALTDEKLI